MLKLHLIDLLSTCYTANFATHTVTSQTDMELRPNISAVCAISSSQSAANCLSQLTARA